MILLLSSSRILVFLLWNQLQDGVNFWSLTDCPWMGFQPSPNGRTVDGTRWNHRQKRFGKSMISLTLIQRLKLGNSSKWMTGFTILGKHHKIIELHGAFSWKMIELSWGIFRQAMGITSWTARILDHLPPDSEWDWRIPSSNPTTYPLVM